MFLLKNKLLVGATVFFFLLCVAYFIVGRSTGCQTSIAKVLEDPLTVALLPTEVPIPKEAAEHGEKLFRFLNMLYSERALYETEGLLGEGSSPKNFVFDKNLEKEFHDWHLKHFTEKNQGALVAGFRSVYLGNLKRAATGGEADKKRFLIRAEAIRDLFARENEKLANVFCLDKELKL